MTRKFALMAVALMLVTMAFGPVRATYAAPAQQTGPQTWTVLVGGQGEISKTDEGLDAGAWQFMNFYPNKITINEGDTIVWKLNSVEFHEVIFPAPGEKYVPFVVPQGNPPSLVVNPLAVTPTGGPNYDGTAATSSGLLDINPPGVKQYQLTFTKAGTYNYLCSTHSSQLPDGTVVGMMGNVTVQAAGSALPKAQAQIDADAQAAIAADAQAGAAAEPTAKQTAAPETHADGSMLYHVNVGFDIQDGAYMRFSPGEVTIHVGDAVQWTQTSAVTPHTITLLSGGKEPDLVVPQPQPSGPPNLVINPQIVAPAGDATYAGTGFYNSGFISGTQDPAPGPRTYTLTFTKPGRYEFICSLHDQMGMSGYVNVVAAGATPGMPATGEPTTPLGLMGLMALVMLLAGFVVRRRSARRLQS